MHPASISAKIHEEWPNKLKHAVTLDCLVDSRLKYNAAELRGIIKHTSCQTSDSFVNATCCRIDQASQVHALGPSPQELDFELDALRLTLEGERSRFQQREKLLIAQMNALRDMESATSSDIKTRLSFSAKSVEFDLSMLPEQYDRIEWSIACQELGRDDRVLDVVYSNSSFRIKSSVEITSDPIELHVPRAAGQVALFFRFLARSSGSSKSLFPLIIGEWSSPLFIPCLKEQGSIDTVLATVEGVGVASFELVFG